MSEGAGQAHSVNLKHLDDEVFSTFMDRKMKTLRYLMLGLASATLLAACGDGNDDSFDDRADIADPKPRFVHAAPAAPAFTLVRNGAPASNATGAAYKYAFATTLNAKRGNKYTLVALPSGTAAELLLIDDPYNKGLSSNTARVRVVNASVNAANVDVYLTAPGVDLATVGPNFSAVPFKQARPTSGNDSVDLDGGAYQLRVTTAATKNVIFNANVTLAKNADWLLLTLPTDGIGTVTPNAIKLLLAKSDDSSNASVEIVSQ